MRLYNEEVLAGIEVTAVHLLKASSPTLYLTHPNGFVAIEVEGDCCSSAFIDKVRFDLPLKLNGRYTEVKADNMLTTDQEVDDITAVKFDESYSGFEHRNSSNGYYGNCWRARVVDSIPTEAVLLEHGRYGWSR